MARGIFKLVSAVLAVSAASISMAQAGGFGRGTADTDILYEEGNFDMRAGVTIVSPSRKFTKALAPLGGSLVGTDYTGTYVIPSAAIKMNVTDDMRCAGSFVNSNGGNTEYVVPFGTSAKRSEKFTTNEFGLTCGYKIDLSKGRFWILGGVFYEVFDYDLSAVGGAIDVKLDGTDLGFRVGAAYEIPEIALRAQLMYRSGTSYGADGTTTRLANTGGPLDGLPLGVALPIATGTGNLPQSWEMKLQSGIAPGWLAFGSVKWTDWSVTDTLDLHIAPGVDRANIYNWKDGWTVNAGIGHAFTEKVSGAVQVTWDQGVGTGWDLSSDTWTLGLGGSFKDDLGGELRGGVGITYIAGAEETRYAAPINSAVDSGWAFAVSGSYKVKW
jgi:long-chain fatty acid transport protein